MTDIETKPERLPDWETQLHEFMLANRDREFAWGEWDCILFATAAAAAITGVDKAEAFRGQYSDETGARETLRKLGKGTLLKTINHYFEPKPVGYAVRGDMIWHAGCAGICMGATAAFVTDPEMMDALEAPRNGSFVMLPRSMWQKAWAV
ncbi:hypothetical protein [Synechococcus phage Yong-M3-232]|nr:hypothetical protein [Synechococcus phage Yong-M3-232]